MRSEAKTISEYLARLPEDRKAPMTKLYKTIKKNLPKGFEEGMAYGLMGWAVPFKTYPAGYHCDPSTPVPFMTSAACKRYAVNSSGVPFSFTNRTLSFILAFSCRIRRLRASASVLFMEACVRRSHKEQQRLLAST